MATHKVQEYVCIVDESGNPVGSTSSPSTVQGPVADGAAFGSNKPVVFAGVDGSGNVQQLLTNTSGGLAVAPHISGSITDGANVNAFSVLDSGGTARIYPALGYVFNGSNVDRVRSVSAASSTTGTGLLGVSNLIWDGTNFVRHLTASQLGDGITGSAMLAQGGWLYNGTTWDRPRSASGAAATTGTGLMGVGALGFDGTNFQLIRVESSSNPNLNVTLRQGANTVNVATSGSDGDAASKTGIYAYTRGGLFNGSTWDRQLSTSTGVQASGRFMVELSDSSAVQAAAYAANDLVGGKRTITSAVRTSGGTGIIRGVTIVDQAANSAANSVYDLYLFNSDPSGTTFTENSPLDIADADMSKVIGVIRIDGVAGSTLFTNVDNNILYKPVEIPIVQSGTTSLFAALIARGGPTFAATTDVVVKLMVQQN